MTLRQRLQFGEMLVFYLNAFTVLVYIPSVISSLLGWMPLTATATGYVQHMLPLVLATEVWLLVLNHPYADRRRRQRHPVRALWRQRIMVTGLAPIYMKATLQAILNGPRRKPVYTVTRKEDDLRWHWRHTLPQTAVVLLIPTVAIYALVHGRLPGIWLVAGTLYWGGLNIVLLAGFVTRGWHGVARVRRGARRRAQVLAGPRPQRARA